MEGGGTVPCTRKGVGQKKGGHAKSGQQLSGSGGLGPPIVLYTLSRRARQGPKGFPQKGYP